MNLTLTVDEEVIRWARIEAARRGTSVSRLVGELLHEKMREDEGYSAAMEAFLGRQPQPLKRTGRYPTRDALHER